MFATAPSPAATPLTAKGRATRRRIVAAAAELVHDRGVGATSLDDVRAATGTSKSQLYHYFHDKSALVHAVVGAQVDTVVDTQRDLLAVPDSLNSLQRWRDRIVEITADNGPEGGCPLGQLAAELAATDETARGELVDGFTRWRALLEEGLQAMTRRGELLDDADPERLALGLLAAVQGGLLLARTARSVDPLAAALDLALAGVAAQVRR